ncbi:MAG: dihydrofolate reductase [Bacteroidales bacterium]|nr:dihydrofolate reductase [Bacteroidales bacterium]
MDKPGEKKQTISVIVAVAENGAIGRDNQLLWHITEDLKYFKHTTQGCPVIMGHKTWLSIGRPLPGRRNIVLSRSLVKSQEAIHENSHADYRHIIPGAELYSSLEEALSNIQNFDSGEVFIIGGGEVYRQALPLADKLYLTKVHITVNDADTFFPEIDISQWHETFRETHNRGERFEHPFEFIVYERVNR